MLRVLGQMKNWNDLAEVLNTNWSIYWLLAYSGLKKEILLRKVGICFLTWKS